MKAALRTLVAATAILTASCQDKAPVIIKGDDGWLKSYTDPHYSEPRKMRGFVHFFTETSAITLCRDNQGECRLFYEPYRGEPLDCWLEFSEKARTVAHQLDDGSLGKFIELQGRITGANGIYGHMGAYPCQVEIDHLDAVYEHAPATWGKEAALLIPPDP